MLLVGKTQVFVATVVFDALFTRTVKATVFCTVPKWVYGIVMVLFTQNVWKIEGATRKNGDVDGTCKQTLILIVNWICNEGNLALLLLMFFCNSQTFNVTVFVSITLVFKSNVWKSGLHPFNL